MKRLFKEKFKNFEFHFIGPIPAKAKIINSQVIYHGEIRTESKIRKIISNCDVLVCPSYSEGMPTVISEAMGLAIIATDVGAVQEMVDGNGWLIHNSRPKTIQKALIKAFHISND